MNDLFLEAVGFLAGSIITSAAMPRVLDILRDPGVARGESYTRNAMLVLGNLIWVVYGVAGDALAIVVMAARGCASCCSPASSSGTSPWRR